MGQEVANTAIQSGSFLTGFIKAFKDAVDAGEPWLFFIAIAFAFAVGFALERFWRLFFQLNIDGQSFMFDVQKHILANDIEGAIRVCNGASAAALPKVIKAGLQRASRTDEQIQNAIDAVSLEMIPKLEKRLGYLALIANVATLLGLLGTIAGLIKSFNAIGEAKDAIQRQALLGQGIAEAMNATAFGLITAIFAMIAHSILTNKATKILEEIDEFGVKLMDLLSARKNKAES
ncbi:MAG: MotA/TolQ/ExbB proton channel family protein [Bacteriovoracia bacterium]